MAVQPATQADGVFEGGGVLAIAFAGAVTAAKQVAGVQEWTNVAGTSAGAIAAALLAAGYDGEAVKDFLLETDYRKFPDYGFGGKYVGGVLGALFRRRGLAAGNYVRDWLADAFRSSRLRNPNPSFGDVVRTDLPPDLTPEEREQARYRLRVVASDISNGRMLVLPDDIEAYEDERGRRFRKDDFPLVEAVRMSVGVPFLFDPIRLHRDARPAYIVDGGLLSNFPVFLFDSPRPRRPTWGFRLHGGTGPEQAPHHPIPRPFWPLPMLRALLRSPMEAADIMHVAKATHVRTVSIPTGDIGALDFGISRADVDRLYRWGYEEARRFFEARPQLDYVNSFGAALTG